MRAPQSAAGAAERRWSFSARSLDCLTCRVSEAASACKPPSIYLAGGETSSVGDGGSTPSQPGFTAGEPVPPLPLLPARHPCCPRLHRQQQAAAVVAAVAVAAAAVAVAVAWGHSSDATRSCLCSG
eukprot:scaffold43695_cov49-Phaeocystis_antarctica.AAC.3